MKTVVIEIDDKYADILSFTCIGVKAEGFRTETNVTNKCIDLSKCTHVAILENGEMKGLKNERFSGMD